MAFLPLAKGLPGGQRGCVVSAETGERGGDEAWIGESGTGQAGPDRAGSGLRQVGWLSLLVVWVLWGSTYFAIRVGWRLCRRC